MSNVPQFLTGAEVRHACRTGVWVGPTAGLAPGYAQANLVVVPHDWAFDFLLFCQRNPRPCPLIAVTEPGSWQPQIAPEASQPADFPGRSSRPCGR